MAQQKRALLLRGPISSGDTTEGHQSADPSRSTSLAAEQALPRANLSGISKTEDPYGGSVGAMTSPIHVVRTVDGSAATVFEAWVSPDTLVDPVTTVEMDPVQGGGLRISVGGDPAGDLHGRFLVVARPHRLSYTWRWSDAPEETIVEVHIREAGPVTVVEVVHRGFLDEVSRKTHLDGWVGYLDALPRFL